MIAAPENYNSVTRLACASLQLSVDVREVLHSNCTFDFCFASCVQDNSVQSTASESQIWYAGGRQHVTVYDMRDSAYCDQIASTFYALVNVLRSARVVVTIDAYDPETVAEVLAQCEMSDNFKFLMQTFADKRTRNLRKLDIHVRRLTYLLEPGQLPWEVSHGTQVRRYVEAAMRIPEHVAINVYVEDITAYGEVTACEWKKCTEYLRNEMAQARGRSHRAGTPLLDKFLQLRSWVFNAFPFIVIDPEYVEETGCVCYDRDEYEKVRNAVQAKVASAMKRAWEAHYIGNAAALRATRGDLGRALLHWSRQLSAWMTQKFMADV